MITSFNINKTSFEVNRNKKETAVFSGQINGEKSKAKTMSIIISAQHLGKKEEYHFGISPKSGLFDYRCSVPIDSNYKTIWKTADYEAIARYLDSTSNKISFKVIVSE